MQEAGGQQEDWSVLSFTRKGLQNQNSSESQNINKYILSLSVKD